MIKSRLLTILHEAAAIVLIMALVLPFCCGSNGSKAQDNTPVSGDGEGSAYTAILRAVLTGIAMGAGSQVGDQGMGMVLNELGWGAASDQEVLASMTKILKDVVTKLDAIEQDLQNLLLELQITKEEIIANTNDPSVAITQINTFHDNLLAMTENRTPGSVPQSDIVHFALTVESNYQIETDVNTIHDAILPSTIAKAPVIDNFTTLALNNVKKGTEPVAAYNAVELYFSQLLLYQLKGVNLVVEAKNAQQRAGNSVNPSAKTYWDDYTKKVLALEVDNFMSNVHRFLLSRVNLVDSTSFLPSDAATILARANFFRIQALNQDHYGLRGTLIATQDLLSGVMAIQARNKTTGQVYSGSGILTTSSGSAYDYWKGNKVKKSSTYTTIFYDFGDVPSGSYDILDGNNSVIGSATVQTYTNDYTVDASGSIHYGHFVITKRVGAKDGFNGNIVWSWWADNLNNASANGSARDRWTGVSGSRNNGEYKGDAELDATFIYDGDSNTVLTLNYSFQTKGSTDVDANPDQNGNCTTIKSTIYYRVGLIDETDHTTVNQFKTNSSKASCDSACICYVKHSLNDNVQGSFSFRPTPGHAYYVYFYNSIEETKARYGQTSSKSDISITSIAGNVYITF